MRFEELKWRANWLRIMGALFEQYPATSTEDKLDYFPGYYYLNGMLTQIARKEEFERLLRYKGPTIFDIAEMESITAKPNNMIGKDMVLHDRRDPLGSQTKSSAELKLLVERFKLYIESLCDLSAVITDLGQRAISHYKNKAVDLDPWFQWPHGDNFCKNCFWGRTSPQIIAG